MPRTRLVVIVALAVAGCTGSVDDGSPGTLLLDESDRGVVGSFVDHSDRDLGRIDFRSELIRDELLEVELEFNGMVLGFLVDYAAGVVEMDGFAAENGEDTHMVEADRLLLRQLSRGLDLLGRDVRDEIAKLRDLASHWSEFPSGMEMQMVGILPEVRGAASACGYVNKYIRSTHDGWFESNWSDKTTLDYSLLSMHGSCRGIYNEDTQGSNFSSGSGWSCPGSEPNHSTSIEYIYGDCFGRCGSGCGSGTVFAWACVDHDNCNRFGHSWSASLPGGHCADEFADAGVQILSEPNCL